MAGALLDDEEVPEPAEEPEEPFGDEPFDEGEDGADDVLGAALSEEDSFEEDDASPFEDEDPVIAELSEVLALSVR